MSSTSACEARVIDGHSIRPCGKKPTRGGLCFEHHPQGRGKPERKPKPAKKVTP